MNVGVLRVGRWHASSPREWCGVTDCAPRDLLELSTILWPQPSIPFPRLGFVSALPSLSTCCLSLQEKVSLDESMRQKDRSFFGIDLADRLCSAPEQSLNIIYTSSIYNVKVMWINITYNVNNIRNLTNLNLLYIFKSRDIRRRVYSLLQSWLCRTK